MKPNPGRIAIVFFALLSAAWGGEYRWNLLESPPSLQVGETGVIRYECAFTTSAADYTIDFKPKSTEAYKVEILTQRDRITEGKRIQTFDLLITPNQSGELAVGLEALVRHTTFASIESATIGRDNVKKYDFKDEKAILPTVRIKALENSADLTGDIRLEAQADATMVRSHEPVHLSLYIRGSGNLDRFVPYELNISGVKVFAEPPQKSFSMAQSGYEGEIRQEFALISDKSYVIPSFTMNVFDTKERRMRQLKTRPIHIEVGEGYDPKTLLDPPDLSDTATLKRYALYGVLVLLGAVLGEAVRRVWALRPRRRAKAFWDEAKSPKELVLILSLSGERGYDEIIRELESGAIGLGEAKKRLASYPNRSE